MIHKYVILVHYYFTVESDFDSTPLTATIPAGTITTTVRVPVMSDNIVEGDEMFSITLNQAMLPYGIRTGTNSNAIVVVKDSSSKHDCI